jgi:DNA-binding MarR family transcriptional regulator
MSPTRTLTDEELALAEAVFAMFSLFKSVTIDAAQSCSLGSPERARILWSLKAGPVRAGGLAQVARLSPSAVSETVEGLERDRLVRREADSEDRRAVRVVLTAEGRRDLQHFEQACAAALTERLAPLTAAQRQRIRAAFNDLREIVPNDFITRSQADATLRPTPRGHKETVNAR